MMEVGEMMDDGMRCAVRGVLNYALYEEVASRQELRCVEGGWSWKMRSFRG